MYNIFKDFMTRITEFEELVEVGSRLLKGFQEGLEFLRRPPIDKTSELIKNIINNNDTKSVRSYLEAGCINTHDGVQNISKLHVFHVELHDYISKGKNILNQLNNLMDDVIRILKTTGGNLQPNWDNNLADEAQEGANKDDEGITLSGHEKLEDTDLAVLMGIIFSMFKQDYSMQEKIILALSLKSSSGELESYSLMWSLRPFVDDDIMHQAWRLIR
ncbi:uncharacterized protein LOC133822514 isoform X2 [Humulus lupulus]|nr:uncharacterized protein LOC133822514 isoform X2 [Humulus lupulus]